MVLSTSPPDKPSSLTPVNGSATQLPTKAAPNTSQSAFPPSPWKPSAAINPSSQRSQKYPPAALYAAPGKNTLRMMEAIMSNQEMSKQKEVSASLAGTTSLGGR